MQYIFNEDSRDRKDVVAIFNLLVYVREEANRLGLDEAAELIRLSELSVFLDLTGLTTEDVEKTPEMMGDLQFIAGYAVNG